MSIEQSSIKLPVVAISSAADTHTEC